VLACSALRRSYRDALLQASPTALTTSPASPPTATANTMNPAAFPRANNRRRKSFSRAGKAKP